MKSKFTFFVSIVLFLPYLGISQSAIQGKILGENSSGISFANVILRKSADSVLVKGAVSDASGNFTISDVSTGKYFIESYMIGYQKSYSNNIVIAEKTTLQLKSIILIEDVKQLNEVTVKASKPLYEMEMGKMIINVQSSITSVGLSAIDVLERSPGVLVNRQNNTFSLAAKDGVIVLINGKRSRMTMDALFQMLEGFNAADIEKIEIMTVPPSNYDSDGDAGLVNIVLKRDKENVGTNGSISTSIGYGSGPFGNMSLNINHQGRKINWFGNLSFNSNNRIELFRNRRINSNEIEKLETVTNAERHSKRLASNYQLGVDYNLSKNTILSALVSGYANRYNMEAPTYSTFDYSVSQDSITDILMHEKNQWQHLMGNINLQHTFRSGHILNVNLDYLTYQNQNPSTYDNNFFTEPGVLIRNDQIRIFKDTPINLVVAKVDYSMSIGESIFLESGLKGTFSNLSNFVNMQKQVGDTWIRNNKLSNSSFLSEDILAAFSSLKYTVNERTSINAGVRYEHTITDLSSQELGNVVYRNYGNFFPTIFVSRKLNKNSNFLLSYGKRITRPSFNEMAPWILFFDPYTFFAGNTNILPTITNNIKADYTYKSFIYSLQYSYDKNVIMRFQPTIDPESNILIYTSDNIDSRHTFAALVALPFQFFPWWEMQNNLTANYQRIQSRINEEFYDVDLVAFQINSTQSFKLPNKYSAELSAFYSSPTNNGYFNWLSRGFVNIGVQKEFKNGGSFKFTCNDIFETTRWKWSTLDESSIGISGRIMFDKRRFVVSYSKKFGNTKVKGARKRAVGSQEEQKRVD
jgi:hypothetical protein